MNNYQFEQISRRMQREYGVMSDKEADNYVMLLFTIESNALKIHRAHPKTNSLHMIEAINLVLHRINGYLTSVTPDLTKFETPENSLLENAILMAFDPFTNEEIREKLTADNEHRLEDPEYLKQYYIVFIRCLLKILGSVKHWIKTGGSDGYFSFIERYFGKHIPKDEDLKYTFPFTP